MMIAEHTDDDLVSAALSGSTSAMDTLFERYDRTIYFTARHYFLPGATLDDTMQEARIGFFKAIQTYKPDGGTTFASFSRMSMERNVISALKGAQRLKRQVLNQASSLDRRFGEQAEASTLVDIIADPQSAEPERIAVDRALHAALVDAVMGAGLSDLEATVLLARLKDNKYQEIAEQVGRTTKAVDNALQRIAVKLKRAVGAAVRAFALA
jgi:RNA polymerase sporulation-specific sigma factor